MWEFHFSYREIVDPRNLKVSTVDTVLLRMVWRKEVSPEVYFHLQSLEQVQLQMILIRGPAVPLRACITVADQMNNCGLSHICQESYRRVP